VRTVFETSSFRVDEGIVAKFTDYQLLMVNSDPWISLLVHLFVVMICKHTSRSGPAVRADLPYLAARGFPYKFGSCVLKFPTSK
jgi:hypothetical protein